MKQTFDELRPGHASGTTRPAPNSLRFSTALANSLWFLTAWALLVLAWELGVYAGWLNPRILPPPSQTIPYALSGTASVGFGTQQTGLIAATTVTLMRVVAGMLGGLVCSLSLSVWVVENRIARRLILPLIQTLAPVSPVAWIPFTIAVIGIGGSAAIFVVFMAVVGSMTLSLVAAIDNIPAEYMKIARNLGTSRFRLWWNIRLPAISASAVTAIRMCFFGAWMAVLAGEMAGINSGLGYMIIIAQQLYNMPLVMIGIMTIGVVGFAADRLLLQLGQKLLKW
jgi:NitT/TauT family transport system permease protein